MTSFSVVMVMVTSGAGGLAEISQVDQKHVIPVEAAYEFGPRKMTDGSTRVPQKKWWLTLAYPSREVLDPRLEGILRSYWGMSYPLGSPQREGQMESVPRGNDRQQLELLGGCNGSFVFVNHPKPYRWYLDSCCYCVNSEPQQHGAVVGIDFPLAWERLFSVRWVGAVAFGRGTIQGAFVRHHQGLVL